MNDFCVFILSHGRAKNVITYKTLRKCGFTGEVYIVIDDEDNTEKEYCEQFKEKVVQFSKLEISKKFDTMDLSEDRRTIVYARNACFEIAKKLGYKYFLELDDDYTSFEYRFPSEDNKKLLVKKCENLDKIFEAMIKFLKTSKAHTVAFAQGGDFIGGIKSGTYNRKVLRKAMNTFFCNSDKPFYFIGRINEDVNTYTLKGSQGWLGFSITDVAIVQKQTQKNAGGMSDVYIESGTYLKSFYSVICMPSAVKISAMGDKHLRLHHNVDWDKCVPKILNEKYKKPR